MICLAAPCGCDTYQRMAFALSKTIQLPSPEATKELAANIAPTLRPGDTLLLVGEIGAGKSHFARALIQTRLAAVGITEDVPSPTFTLVQTYNDTITEIWHADLYRLTDGQEVYELGLEDAFRTAICLVEWPDKLDIIEPANALTIRFEYGPFDDARILTFEANSERWKELPPIIQS